MATSNITYDTFKKYWQENGYEDKDIDLLWNHPNRDSLFTDTKSRVDGVSEPLISPVQAESSPSPKVYRAGRLYQFSSREAASGEVIFGNAFEISYNRESDDLIVIRKRLLSEIKRYEKDKEIQNYETQINEIIDKAIENIRHLYIWKLEPVTNKEHSYIQKIKIGTAEALLNTKE